jgi:hypothetical protein
MEATSSKTDKVNEVGRGRKKKRGGNFDVVLENIDGEEEEDGGDKNNAIESSRSESLGFEHESDEEGIDKVVSSNTPKPRK